MDDFVDESERFYFGRTRHPHCKTCVCPEKEVKVKSKVTVTARKPRRYSPSPTRRDLEFRTCVCGRSVESSLDSSDDSYTSLPSPRRLRRQLRTDHKYGLFESWFQRFDFDSNGLLDLFELRTLLNFLGVRVDDEYCKSLLEKADRDGDGRLTFPEFLLMWRLAQNEDELYDIIREHALYPDVLEVDYFRKHRPEAQVKETVKRKNKYGRRSQHDYESEEIKVFRRSPRINSVEYEKKMFQKFKSKERLPVFSCHR